MKIISKELVVIFNLKNKLFGRRIFQQILCGIIKYYYIAII